MQTTKIETGDRVHERLTTMRIGTVVQTRKFGLLVEWDFAPFSNDTRPGGWQSWHGYGAVELVSKA